MKGVSVDFVFDDRDAIHLPGVGFEIHPPLKTAVELTAGDLSELTRRAAAFIESVRTARGEQP